MTTSGGTYKIMEELHQSRRAIVQLCQANAGSARFVRKVARAEYREEYTAKLQREHVVLQALRGEIAPALRPMQAEGESDSIAMEWVPFASLHSQGEHRRWTDWEVIELLVHAVEAIDHLHSKGIIHQQLQPEHLLWSPEQQSLRLLSFGSSYEAYAPLPDLSASWSDQNALPYMAPEQLSRQVPDHRTDFYGIGAVAWRLLVGRPPFVGETPQVLRHRIQTARVRPPRSVRSDVSLMLSQLLLKLMAKDPQLRYQSAAGLLADLHRCREDEAAQSGHLFALGQQDAPQRGQERFFGRQQELRTLYDHLDAACDGASRLILLAGEPGVGKSTLARQLEAPAFKSGGSFVSSRFEPLKTKQPYQAISSALRQSLRLLLQESPRRQEHWRQRLAQLGEEQVRALLPFLPELTAFLGAQDEALKLPPKERQFQLHRSFSALLCTLAGPQHPLVLFLDDLQWADASSLALLRALASAPQLEGCLLLCGYRNTKADSSADLEQFISDLHGQQSIHYIALQGFTTQELAPYLADILHVAPTQVRALSGILQEKTKGNPFFARVLLRKLLREQQLTRVDHQLVWDEQRLRRQAATDNVVSLLVESLGQSTEPSAASTDPQMAADTLALLQLASCWGSEGQIADLAALTESTGAEVAGLLQPAVQEGFLRLQATGQGDVYQFVHDRIQEAVSATLSRTQQEANHLQIARYLQGAEAHATKLYKVISHYQKGIAQLTQAEERHKLIELAFKAGQQAREEAAFEESFHFFSWGLELLGDQGWDHHYDLTLQFHQALCQISIALKDPGRGKPYANALIDKGRTLIDQYPGWRMKIRYLVANTHYEEALALANTYFREAEYPEFKPSSKVRLAWDLLRTLWMLWRFERRDQPLGDVASQQLRNSIQLEFYAAPSAIHLSKSMIASIMLRSIRYMLKHGYTDLNVQAWTGAAGVMTGILGRIDKGIAYAELAEKLALERGSVNLWPRIAHFSIASAKVWRLSQDELMERFQELEERAWEVGDSPAAFESSATRCIVAVLSGRPLTWVISLLEQARRTFQQYSLEQNIQKNQVNLQYIDLLQQQAPPPPQPLLTEDHKPEHPLSESSKISLQMHLYVLFGDWQRAIDLAISKQDKFHSTVHVQLFNPFCKYSVVALYEGLTRGWLKPGAVKRLLKKNQKHMQRWCKARPDTRAYLCYWMRAEELSYRGVSLDALKQYDLAIEQSAALEAFHDAGLIAERAALLCERNEHHRLVQHYLSEALQMYERWGAHAKVAQLLQRHPALPSASQPQRQTPAMGLPSQPVLEQQLSSLHALQEASSALSQLDNQTQLLQRFMGLLMEQSGATHGLLLQQQPEGWMVLAEATLQEEVLQPHYPHRSVSLDHDADNMPAAILRYVVLSHEPVILNDAAHEGPFVREPYIAKQQPRSALALPLLLHNKLVGMVYLEHFERAGLFTEERKQLLEVIATQAAIGLQSQLAVQKLEQSSLESESWQDALAHATRDTPQMPLRLPHLMGLSRQGVTGSATQPQAKERHGPWQIEEALAEGGMSTLHIASHVETGELCALKLLSTKDADDAVMLQRFQREAQTLKRLQHPHIVRLLDCDLSPARRPYMALSLLQGETLQDIMDRHAPLPLGWMLGISEQICETLAYIHEQGVIHRDLKPANVFLSPGEPFPHVHLLDFGIAGSILETRLTSTGVIIGTPAYLAPEQLKEKEQLSTATDLYALGVLWFEALTGKHPLGSGASVELFVKILQEEPTRLGQLRPEFRDSSLEQLLGQLFAKNPRERPQSARTVWDELAMSGQFTEDPLDQPGRYPEIKTKHPARRPLRSPL